MNGLKEQASISDQISEVVELNDYAVQTRYPGEYSPIEKSEYERALKLAKRVVKWVENIIE